MSPNTTPNAERLSAGRLEATTVLLLVQGRDLRQCRYLRAIDLTSFPFAARQGPQPLRDRGGGRHRIPQSLGVWVITRLPPAAKPDVQPLHIRNARGDGVAHHHRNAVACPNQSRGGRSWRLCPSPHLMRNALKPSRRDQRKQFLSALKRLQEGLRDLRDVTVHEECLAATRLRRGDRSGCAKEIARLSNSLAMHVRYDYVPLAQFRTCLWPCVGRWASGQEAGQPPEEASRFLSYRDRQPEAKPAYPALNGGRGLKQRRSGLFWSRWPSKGQHRRGLSILPAVRIGNFPLQSKAASRVKSPARLRRVSIARRRQRVLTADAGRPRLRGLARPELRSGGASASN